MLIHARKKYFRVLYPLENVKGKNMKISRISGGLNLNRVQKQNKQNNNFLNNINVDNNNNKNFFQVYFGKDLVSFKAAGFKQTLDANYYHLPEGCYPDSFQLDAGKALYEGRDVLVEAPTGTGKTAIAHYAASKNMAEGKTTIYTTPLKALSNQKLNEFKAVYGDENVGILTGDRRENVEAPVLIMTTEVYRNMALSNKYGEKNPLMENLGTVIFDEFHYLGDEGRGPVWEESVMLTPGDVQILELSATIGNPEDLKGWESQLKDGNISLISMPPESRAVPLEYGSITTSSYKDEEKRLKKALKKNGSADLLSSSAVAISKPNLSDFKLAVNKLDKKEQLPAIFFVFSRNYSRELVEYLGAEGSDLTTQEEKEEIQKIVDEHKAKGYIGSDLDMQALKKGYAIHNAGIIPSQKELIEELFQKKLTKVVVATETLAAGINMPAKTVVISSPYKPSDNETTEDDEGTRPLTANEFKQMAGRAGRRGIDTVGYVYTMPTDKATESEFLYMEAMDSNPIKSRYNPEYSFLAGYYEYNKDDKALIDLMGKSFYAYSKDSDVRDAKVKELADLSQRKTDILLDRGFLKRTEGGLELTQLGYMASKVKGYDALTLAETIADKKFEGITPEALAMIAGAMANPANPKEAEIGTETDLSPVFEASADNLETVYNRLTSSVNAQLKKFGKDIDSFVTYHDLLNYLENMEQPDASEAELREELQQLEAKRAKAYTITKTTGKYSIPQLVDALNNGQTVPTRILEEYYDIVERYKNRINMKSIDDYIEKQQAELDSLDTSSKGNKAKSRIERKRESIQKEIDYAKAMKLFDEKIMERIGENYQFMKKNPLHQIRQDYQQADEMYARLTSKDRLIRQVKGLMSIEESKRYENAYDIIDGNANQVRTCFNALIKKALDIHQEELENGISSKVDRYGKSSAETVYNWAMLNNANTESMTNWYQLLKIIPETDADEGTIYRRIMQTADLLSQISEMADAGYKTSETQEDKKYYFKLRGSAKRARDILIRYPIEV